MEITEKDLGRRVVVNGHIDEKSFENEPGRLIKIDNTESLYTIEFDRARDYFHQCITARVPMTEPNHGFYVREEMITFTDEEDQDFQVGDEVECLLYGDGVAKSISDRAHDSCPVEVRFRKTTEWYKKNGALDNFIARTLYHKGSIKREGSKIIIDPVKPVREKWVNVYIDANGDLYFGFHRYSTKDKGVGYGVCAKGYITTIQLKRPDK